jgi:hypothetical protein
MCHCEHCEPRVLDFGDGEMLRVLDLPPCAESEAHAAKVGELVSKIGRSVEDLDPTEAALASALIAALDMLQASAPRIV